MGLGGVQPATPQFVEIARPGLNAQGEPEVEGSRARLGIAGSESYVVRDQPSDFLKQDLPSCVQHGFTLHVGCSS